MKFLAIFIFAMFVSGCSYTSKTGSKNIPVPSPEQESLESDSNDINLDVLEAELEDINIDDLDL